jgi:hypothetical protein
MKNQILPETNSGTTDCLVCEKQSLYCNVLGWLGRRSDCYLVLFRSSLAVTTRNCYTWNLPVALYILTGRRPLVFFCSPGSTSLASATSSTVDLFGASGIHSRISSRELPTNNCLGQSQSQSQSHIATDGQSVSQSVSLGVEPHLGLKTRYSVLFDSYGLVFFFVGRPLWREDGSVFCQSHCLH